MALWKVKFTKSKLLFREMYHTRSMEKLFELWKFEAKLGPEHPVSSAKYSAALQKKFARIYCDCMCIRKDLQKVSDLMSEEEFL